MVLASPAANAVCRARVLISPRVFCRHKSLHAAIERGRQSSDAPRTSRKPRNSSFESSNPFYDSNGRSREPDRRPPPARKDAFRDSAKQEPGRNDWSCPACGFENFRRNKQCRSCGTGPDGEAPEPAQRNPPKERTGTDDRAPGQFFDWKCGCGFRNFERNSHCRSCGTSKSEAKAARPEPKEYTRPSEARQPQAWESRQHQATNSSPYQSRESRGRRGEYTPESLPYTTAASEFLYGYSSVLAALKARRRKLYKLYVHERGLKNEGSAILLQRAKAAKVDVREVGDDYLPLMDKASSGRPHNGFILESSPLPQPPIANLGFAKAGDKFQVTLDEQSREDKVVNGTKSSYDCVPSSWNRQPLVLYVDGVLDEGNLGAIARSAYFLGVDAIATPTRQSAPWSHIAVKASAGAAEAIPVFKVNKPADFLQKSALEGWRIYASDAIPEETSDLTNPSASIIAPAKDQSSAIIFSHAHTAKRLLSGHSPLLSHPCILMMGAEGTGLRNSLLNSAHYKVGIAAGRGIKEIGVDSLNVSAAASLLCFEFLKKPILPSKNLKPGEQLF